MDAREARGRREAEDVGDEGRRVERGLRVGHARDGRKATGRGGRRAGRDRLLVRLPRLAQVYVHVDEAGRDDRAARVDDVGFLEAPVVRLEVLADLGDRAVFDANVAHGIETLGGIDDAPPADEQVHTPGPFYAERLFAA